jgi:hypothetical protein
MIGVHDALDMQRLRKFGTRWALAEDSIETDEDDG